MLYRDALSLLDYWADFPPTHLLARWALGFKAKGSAPKSSPSREELEALVASFGRAD